MKYISNVRLTNFMNRGKTLNWNLNPDVNILGGANGSGKSRLLETIQMSIIGLSDYIRSYVCDSVELYITDTETGLTNLYNPDDKDNYISDISLKDNIDMPLEDIKDYIYGLWRNNKPENHKMLSVEAMNNILIDKRVNLSNSDELRFVIKDYKDSPIIPSYRLTIGEQRLIWMVLNAVNARIKGVPTVMLLDIPEYGLHIDYQRILLRYLNRLCPDNMQIICATHAPSMIDGYRDKVYEINQILKNEDNQ